MHKEGTISRRNGDGTFDIVFKNDETGRHVDVADIQRFESEMAASQRQDAAAEGSTKESTGESKANSPHDATPSGAVKSEDPPAAGTGPSHPSATKELTPYDIRVVPTRREDLVKFLLLPPYRGVNKRIRCYIKRSNSAIGMNRLYSFYLEPPASDDKNPEPRLLMYAKKTSMSMNKITYLISLDRDDMGRSYNDRSKWYLGKLQSKGRDSNQFYVYDRGMNSEDLLDMNATRGSSSTSRSALRQSAARRELAVIVYNRGANVKGQKRIEVGLPAIVRDDGTTVTEAQFRPFSDADSLMTVFNNIRNKGQHNATATKRILILHNRGWSAGKTSELGLFKGRATESSTKNFQLCVSPPSDKAFLKSFEESTVGTREKVHPERVCLQLGRCADRFNVDFTYPMSFFAAFAISLSRFATKASDAF